jgi:hypothetical protein
MLEPHTPHVYIESPPSNDLPRQSDFNRIAIEMSDSNKQRVIYLRPGDTVCFEAEYHIVKILAMKTEPVGAMGPPEGEKSTSANEIQVESSVQQPTIEAGTISGAPEDDDDDDLDRPFATPIGDDDAVAIVETPSGLSRDRNLVLSSTPAENHAKTAVESANGHDTSTTMQPEDDAESQNVLPPTGRKPLKKYGGTPRRKREIPESSDQRDMSPGSADDDHAVIEHHRGETQSSPPKRKHSMSMSDDDEDDGAVPASTAPPLKRPRGRPPNASKAARALTKTPASVKTGKTRGRPSNAFKAQQAEDAAGHLPSPGKLAAAKPRRKIESPDLNPRSSGTPQPSTPMTGKPPSKILLSNSKFAEGKVAKAFLKQNGATIEGTIPKKRTDFVCVVGNGDIATTAKVLHSLALGKKVVSDQWIEDSMSEGVLLELDGYIHEDLAETADLDRGKLLKGKTLFITNAQMKAYGGGFDSIKELAMAVGAQKVESGSAKKGSGTPAASTVILGGDGSDPDALKLTEEEGRVVYQKTLLTQSVIRGELLVDMKEFKWQKAVKKGKK